MTKVVNFKKNCSSANIAVHTTIYCAPKNVRPGLEHAHWDCIPKSGDNENTGSFSNSTVLRQLSGSSIESMLENARCQLRVNMPRTYERKTNRQSWSQESMEGAIEKVLSGRMGYLKASMFRSLL
ncbi:hypothetical protein JTB14_026606 [Gonioctena quinquepunctata]|nr:hypothetical protein JTB14_026606 [Gonioctena quinquepunctata]